MKRYRASVIAGLIGLAVCLFNYTGYDPHNIVFFMLSVPAWVVEFFRDVHEVSVLLMYGLTIVSWALIGLAVDWFTAVPRARRRTDAG
ncbi:hypothetical protein IDH44_12430 [Paenibacillus sp. IB182496]|uniref:Uncharacterized protein n=1 Tax=Paenibacillus sabuli TaxID=2772509 RepID=A0A927GRZ3_9BACL|nr:hypothetical protein [Paenibacillus sabuli]MBD2846003.1 hypothetical protein [Paenibacillus sabuli]